MRPTSQILLAALLALCWSGLAAANQNEPVPSLDPSAFRAIMNMQLDSDVEKVALEGDRQVIHGLAGPSSMDCSHGLTKDDIETCVVTTPGPRTVMPTALAQH